MRPRVREDKREEIKEEKITYRDNVIFVGDIERYNIFYLGRNY